MIDDKSIDHAKVSATYYLGSLPSVSKLRWFFSDQPLLLAMLGVLLCILLAAVAYRPLKRLVTNRIKNKS